ncbi:MAG: ABC transporter substrate-binding protein [Armatimonadota bacterium]
MIFAIAVLVAAALSINLPAATGQARTIRLGLLTSMTGPAAGTGQDQLRAVTLAMDEINARGVRVREAGANLKLELLVGDDQTSTTAAVSAVTRLIVENRVNLVFGGLGSAFGMAALPVIQEHGVPYIPTPSTPLFTRTLDHGPDARKSMVFHYQATGLMYGAGTADFLANHVKPVWSPDRPLRVAWLYQDSPFGAEYFKGFVEQMREANLPIEVVAGERFRVGETDYRPQLTRIRTLNPHVFIPMGFRGETIGMINQAILDIGIDFKVTHFGPVCACADDPLYYRDVGKLGIFSTLLGIYSTHAIPRNPAYTKWAEFRKNFEQKFGVLPGVLGASGYDVVYVAAKAVENAGSLEKAKIIEALGKLEMDQIVLPIRGGKIRFDARYREVPFLLFTSQMFWDEKARELRPVIVWPTDLADARFRRP